MMDFLGQPLALNDWVVTVPKGYKEFVKAQIVGFTAKQVRVTYSWPHTPQQVEQVLRNPSNVVRCQN